jgi:hypothetical protein
MGNIIDLESRRLKRRWAWHRLCSGYYELCIEGPRSSHLHAVVFQGPNKLWYVHPVGAEAATSRLLLKDARKLAMTWDRETESFRHKETI